MIFDEEETHVEEMLKHSYCESISVILTTLINDNLILLKVSLKDGPK